LLKFIKITTLKNYNILVTGYKGFIGSSLLSELKKDKPNKFSEILLFEKDDIDENKQWERKLEELVESSQIIFHIGADSNTLNHNVNEVIFYNYYFSKILFDFVGSSNKRVIYSSSAACYGSSNIPENIYGWSKYLAEQYGLIKIKNFNALRYFNVYGPGENHKGKMSSVAYQALTSSDPYFKLFPGNPKRDFIYIKDVINANIFCMMNDINKGVYDVGTGEQKTFENILEILNKKVDYYDSSIIPENYQFSTQANKNKFIPGWKAEYNLNKGLKAYIESTK